MRPMVALHVLPSGPDDDFTSALFGIPAFFRDAACVEHVADPDVDWFPARGASSAPAKAVCQRCLCRADCLAYALEAGIAWGIWGGLSPAERKALRSSRRRASHGHTRRVASVAMFDFEVRCGDCGVRWQFVGDEEPDSAECSACGATTADIRVIGTRFVP